MDKHTNDKLRTTKTPRADFSAHRKILKEAIMDDYNTNFEPAKEQPKSKAWALKLTGSFAVVAVAAVFAFSTLVSGTLTAQKVLAEAQQSQASQQQQGRYHYSKTIFTDTFNDEEHKYISEIWEDTETLNHRMRMSDEDGNVIHEIVSVDGKLYASPFDGEEGEPGLLSTPVGVEAIELTDEEIAELGDLSELDGASGAANVTILEGDIDLNELDLEGSDTIVANGAVAFEIGELDLDDLELQEVDLEAAGTVTLVADGDMVEVIGADPFFTGLNDIVQSSTAKERAELFNTLLEEDGAELVEQMAWQGMQVVGVQHTEFGDFTSTMYFDADTYEYVGSEGSGSDGFSFSEVISESTYSDTEIDLSTDGLEELI